MTHRFTTLAPLLALLAGGCAQHVNSALPTGAAAYQALAVKPDATHDDDTLRIGDKLRILVLGEPELSGDLYRVDANGYVEVPLAGEVIAAGRTARELRDDLAHRFAARFLRDPQVAVIVSDRAKTTFAVEGDVREPGVFEAAPNTTLLSALAMAKSPSNTASYSEVMVFRTVGEQHMGARFKLSDIRAGLAADPQILAGDTIVVGHSALKGAWREFLQAAPVFNLFYIFR